MIKPRSVSGLADYSEAENVALSKWIRLIENEYRLFGFSRLIPRPMELREVLLSKGGVQNLIFGVSRLHNDKPTDLALPFDRTVPLANWIARRESEVTFPYKRYDISYSYRGERSQAGRLQGFFQADVDIIGRGKLDISADSEIINVIFSALTRMGLKNMYVCINDLKLTNRILQALQIPRDKNNEILRIVDSILKKSKEELLSELKSAYPFSDEQLTTLWNIFSYQGTVDGFVGVLNTENLMNEDIENALKDILSTTEMLKIGGISEKDIVFFPAIVRGLDYYTGIVFETFIRGFENIGSIASGGRYDNLASIFTKSVLPGVGGTIGLSRLFYIAVKNNFIPLNQCTESDFFIGFREHSFKNDGMEISYVLRNKGYYVDLYSGTDDFKKQLSYASKKGFEKSIFVMDDNSVILKDLVQRTQVEFSSISDLLDTIPPKRISHE